MKLNHSLLLAVALFFVGCKFDQNPVQSMDIQGHRGCRGLMPENTIAGFKKALDLGVTTLELDLSVNGEGDVIVSHEPFFNHEISTGPGGVLISEEDEKQHNTFQLSQLEIECYDVGLRDHPRFPLQKKVAATKPRLDSMVKVVEAYAKEKSYPAPLYNMEIKRHPLGDGVYHPSMQIFADKVIATIDSLGIAERTTVQCFDVQTLRYLKETYDHQKLVYLIENKDTYAANIKKLGFLPHVYSPYFELIDAKLVARCKKDNIKLIPWTVNEEKDIENMISMDVDGIISDYPDRVIEIYDAMH